VIIIAIGIVIMGLKTIIADEALLVWSSPVRVVCISVIRGRLMLMSASPWCEHTYSHICFATLPFGHTRRRRSDGAIAANRAIKRTFIDLQIILGAAAGAETPIFWLLSWAI